MNAPDRGLKDMAKGKEQDPNEPKAPSARLPFGSWNHSATYACNKDPRVNGNVCTKVEPSVDVQDRTELFLLDDDEKKVEIEPETRVPNASIFTFNKEDHTLGNLLRAKLVKSAHVLFAGYQIPHPLFATFKLRVQTDGEVTPREAVVQACQELVKELQMLDQEFTKEWELKKIAGGGPGF